jgi:hypothetical protein
VAALDLAAVATVAVATVSGEVRLDAESIEAVARRVAALLDDPSPLPHLLTAAEVADRLGVGEEWVRENADRLGGVRLSSGARPRLRFPPAAVAEALSLRSVRGVSSVSRSGSDAEEARSPRRSGPATIGQKVPLLPAAVGENRVKPASSPKSKTGRRRDNGPPPTPRMDPSTPAERSPRGAKRASGGGGSSSEKEEAR